jgi:hypothetical protein
MLREKKLKSQTIAKEIPTIAIQRNGATTKISRRNDDIPTPNSSSGPTCTAKNVSKHQTIRVENCPAICAKAGHRMHPKRHAVYSDMPIGLCLQQSTAIGRRIGICIPSHSHDAIQV